MTWQLVPLAAAAASAWRNGGGSTRELLAWPSAADWRVRVSVADVERDGPFSAFPGIERWFAVLEGEGVALVLDGATHALARESTPFCFDGAAAVACSLLAGPTRDFNLMAPPGRAKLLRLRGVQRFAAGAGTLLGLYAHHGKGRISHAGGVQDVPPATLAWCLVGEGMQVEVEAGDALWMEVMA